MRKRRTTFGKWQSSQIKCLYYICFFPQISAVSCTSFSLLTPLSYIINITYYDYFTNIFLSWHFFPMYFLHFWLLALSVMIISYSTRSLLRLQNMAAWINCGEVNNTSGQLFLPNSDNKHLCCYLHGEGGWLSLLWMHVDILLLFYQN